MNVENISVIVDDGQVPVSYSNYALYDNSTHRWVYFTYPYSVHRIEIIPEFPSLFIVALLMIATIVIIFYKCKQVGDRNTSARAYR
jgi:hypothetical protein